MVYRQLTQRLSSGLYSDGKALYTYTSLCTSMTSAVLHEHSYIVESSSQQWHSEWTKVWSACRTEVDMDLEQCIQWMRQRQALLRRPAAERTSAEWNWLACPVLPPSSVQYFSSFVLGTFQLKPIDCSGCEWVVRGHTSVGSESGIYQEQGDYVLVVLSHNQTRNLWAEEKVSLRYSYQ